MILSVTNILLSWLLYFTLMCLRLVSIRLFTFISTQVLPTSSADIEGHQWLHAIGISEACHDWESLCDNLHNEIVIDQTLLLSSIFHDAECVKARLASFVKIQVYRTQHQADTTHRKFTRIVSKLTDLGFLQVSEQEKAWPHQLAIHHQLADLDRYLRDIESRCDPLPLLFLSSAYKPYFMLQMTNIFFQ